MDGSDISDLEARIAPQILAAAVDPGQWQNAVAELANVCSDGTAHLYGTHLRTGAPLLTAAAGHDPDALRSYADYYARINPFAEAAPQVPVGRPVSHVEAVPEETLLRTEFYNDWLRPQGHLYGGGGVQLFRSDEVVVSCSVMFDEARREALQDDIMALIHRLAPVLRHAWQVNQRLAQGALERAVLARERPGDPAVLVVNATGRPGFANAAAQAELVHGSAVGVELDGSLRFADNQAQSALSHALWATRQGTTPAATEVAFERAGRRMTATLSRVDTATIDGWNLGVTLGLTERHLLITLHELAEAPDLAGRLRVCHQLAPAEAEVAVALWQGQDPAGVAEAREVSIHTVRNQIRSAASKCGVRRQTELVALVGRLHAELQARM